MPAGAVLSRPLLAAARSASGAVVVAVAVTGVSAPFEAFSSPPSG